ncbi:efflux RND transporter periplasmic adaptor subunit [Salinisphaera sp. SPP-AMP-43]|uniref:efflux RND transporter periplasmic adaptor subunit n=1 Tax=Salinisphaera sp. SPP-AMP-43 TaxID=3121288 RepID=UPI003C6DDFBA
MNKYSVIFFTPTLCAIALTTAVLSGCDGQAATNSTHQGHDATSTEPDSNSSSNTDQAGHDSAVTHQQRHSGHGAHREVHLTDEQRQRLNIKVTTAVSGSASDTLTAPATVRFDADRVSRVGPRLKAKVIRVAADLGDQVEAGDTLAVLDSVELGKAKARYLTTAAHYRNAAASYRRKRELAEDRIISEAALDESKAQYQAARASCNAARAELALYGLNKQDIAAIAQSDDSAPLSRYELTAPIAGTVQARDVVRGQTLASNDTPFQIVNNSRLWAMLQIAASDVSRIERDQDVDLQVRSLPDSRFSGRIDWVSRELDQKSRTLSARAVIDNRDGHLVAGMFGTATIQAVSSRDYALVPVDAVQSLNEKPVVFVPGDKDETFRAETVATGAEANGRIEIRQGLAPGDRLVTQGAFDLLSALTSGSRSAAHSH